MVIEDKFRRFATMKEIYKAKDNKNATQESRAEQ